MNSKVCSMCNIENNIREYDNKFTKSKNCICKRGIKRYCDNKDKMSIQQKIYYEKKQIT